MDKTYDNTNLMERSLLASRDHVFLTWHDINFVVPRKVGDTSNVVEDERAELLEKHRIQTRIGSAESSIISGDSKSMRVDATR